MSILEVQVVGTGSFLPSKVQTSLELAPLVGKSAEWIIERTGVVERRIADRPVEEMAAQAARAALGEGEPPDLIVYASLTPRQLIPDTSVYVQRELGLSGIASYSVHATCLSFIVGLQHAGFAVAGGVARRVLVVSAETGTVSRDLSEPESAVLIGDGAAAAVLEATPEGERSAILGFRMATYPEGAELTELPGGGVRHHPNDPGTRPEHNLFHMQGPRAYRFALPLARPFLDALFAEVGLGADDIDLVVPHQASLPALKALPALGFPPERVVSILEDTGNCIAASIPMALARAHADGRLQRGHHVLLLGTGAGLSLGAMVIRW
jgi:3-oxoacyl-[acyl-carrier-protein] synthase-3